MNDSSWFFASGATLIAMCVSAVGIYVAVLLFTRLSGLRSFSKMSSFDFAVTIAVGSILASTIVSKTPSLSIGVLALALLYAIQYLVAKSRRLSTAVEWLVDNEPLVLMAGDEILPANLDKARITEGDLNSKLRMAGITHRNQVLAVILETTGDVSVLRRGEAIDPTLFAEVRDGHRIPGIGPNA